MLSAVPISPRRLNRGLDRDLEAVVLKALCKDPVHRYPTAQALADDLNHWLRREPVTARPAAILRRFGFWSQRQPGTAAATAIAALALLLIGSVGPYLGIRAAATSVDRKA